MKLNNNNWVNIPDYEKYLINPLGVIKNENEKIILSFLIGGSKVVTLKKK